MITVNPNNQITLLPVDNEFVNRISNNITMYGQIPYTIPNQLLIDEIIRSAKFFYQWYQKAIYATFYHIDKNDIVSLTKTLEFAKFRSIGIKLHPKIAAIKEIYPTNRNSDTTSTVLMENIQWNIQHNSAIGQSLLGINSNLFITEAACKMMEEAAFDSIFGHGIPFEYNNLTHELQLFDTLTTNVILEVESCVDVQVLYNDGLFERHVVAHCKQQLKRLLGGHTFELPGGVTVSADEICNNLEDAEKVEDMVKASSGIGDIIMKR